MKTWHVRRGRNTFRIDFGWYILGNVNELFLSVLLCAWACACVHSLYLCVCNSVLKYASLFLRLCVRGDGPAYAGPCQRTLALSRVCETLGRGFTLPIFPSLSAISLLYAILTPLFVIFAFDHHCILHVLFILALKTSFFIIFAWIKNLMSSSSFAILISLC